MSTGEKAQVVMFMCDLKSGGAERQFRVIADELSKVRKVNVITLYDGDPYFQELAAVSNLRIDCLLSARAQGKVAKLRQFLVGMMRLRAQLYQLEPKWIYSMLFFNNLFLYLATPGRLRNRLVWGMRTTAATSGKLDRFSRWACKKLSSKVQTIISNSYSGARFLQEFGFRCRNSLVIWNGIDQRQFYPHAEEGGKFRAENNIGESDFAVGMVSRIDRLKGHEILFEAVNKHLSQDRNLKVVIVGGGDDEESVKLRSMAGNQIGPERLRWLSFSSSLRPVYCGLDLLVSCSYQEGFSNVVGEAMACGTPCIATDVGDSRRIIDDDDYLIPVGDSEELGMRIQEFREGSIRRSKELWVSRVSKQCSLEILRAQYESVFGL